MSWFVTGFVMFMLVRKLKKVRRSNAENASNYWVKWFCFLVILPMQKKNSLLWHMKLFHCL